MLAVQSREFWSGYQVEPASISVQQSLNRIARRKALYPGIDELMPLEHPGKVVLDFGCGPGSDTIAFLLNGAKYVYAADISPKAISITQQRLQAHGFAERCMLILIGNGWRSSKVDYVHAAGVIHHCADPVYELNRLRDAVNSISRPNGEIRMMVYDADSWFYRVRCGGDPVRFRELADEGAPIANAWTREQVYDIAALADLDATYVGSYLHPGELEGPGLSACYSLKP